MSNLRSDYLSSPPPDRFGTPGVSYPTPNIDDIIIVEDVDIRAQVYRPLEPGTPNQNFPAALLTWQGPVKGNATDKLVRRVYATVRTEQDAYNYALSYISEDNSNPVIIRTYTVLRSEYEPAEKGSPDSLFPGAKLVREEMQPESEQLNSLFVRVTKVFKTLPGPVISRLALDKFGTLVRIDRQEVTADTKPDDDRVGVLSDTVEQTSTTEAIRTTTLRVDPLGAVLTGGFIDTSDAAVDEETGVVLFTDAFDCAADFPLPPIYTAEQFQGPAAYKEWFQPNADRNGYSTNSYSPAKHYPVAARRVGGNGPNARMEVTHCRIPSPGSDKVTEGFQFPAIYDFHPTQGVPANYQARYTPPLAIGADKPYGFTYEPPRQNSQPGLLVRRFSLGKTALPATFRVTSPGAGSQYHRNIRQNTIHPKFTLNEGPFDDGLYNQVELFGPSTPSTYNKTDVLVAWADDKRWRGEIFRQRIMYVSEARPLEQFPSPAADGYWTAISDFTVLGDESLLQLQSESKIYALTLNNGAPGTETVEVLVDGTSADGAELETITAEPTNPTASDVTFARIRSLSIAAATTADDVAIYPPVDPNTASIRFTSNPTDGDELTVGLSGAPVTYTFKNSLSGQPANTVKIADTRQQTLNNLRAAVIRNLDFIGRVYALGTTVHPDVRLSPTGNPNINTFSSRSAVTRPATDYVLTSPDSFATLGSWIDGEPNEPIAVIGQGNLTAFNSRILSNPALLDSAASNDSEATLTLPAIGNLYTRVIEVSQTQPVTLRYNVTGPDPVKLWWLDNFFAVTLTMVNGSTAFVSTPPLTNVKAGDYIAINTMTVPVYRTIADSTHLAEAWDMTSGPYTSSEYGRKLPNAAAGNMRVVNIGVVTSGNVQLRLAQGAPVSARAFAARAEFPVTAQ